MIDFAQAKYRLRLMVARYNDDNYSLVNAWRSQYTAIKRIAERRDSIKEYWHPYGANSQADIERCNEDIRHHERQAQYLFDKMPTVFQEIAVLEKLTGVMQDF